MNIFERPLIRRLHVTLQRASSFRRFSFHLVRRCAFSIASYASECVWHQPHIILSGRGKESIAESLARQGLMTWLLCAPRTTNLRGGAKMCPPRSKLPAPRSVLRAPRSPLLAPRSIRTSLTHFTTAGTIAAGVAICYHITTYDNIAPNHPRRKRAGRCIWPPIHVPKSAYVGWVEHAGPRRGALRTAPKQCAAARHDRPPCATYYFPSGSLHTPYILLPAPCSPLPARDLTAYFPR